MFSLHETQRIYLYRALFVLLCALPTAGVLSWCVFVRTAVYRRMHERAIGHELHCLASMARASNPRPELVLYEGLELADRESGQLLARFPAVEVETAKDRVTIRLSLPGTIDGRRLARWWPVAAEQLRDLSSERTIDLEVGHLTLALPGRDQTLSEVAARLEADGPRSQLDVQFHRATAGEQKGAPVAVRVTRNRGTSPHATEIEATTGDAPLAAEALIAMWPAALALGPQCTLTGRLAARESSAGWQVELAGELEHLDLDRLLASYPHRLTGTARLALAEVLVRDDRVQKAAGTITAGPGTISRSLVQSAMSSLRLESSPRAFAGLENRVNYTQLAARFDLSDAGLALKGLVSNQPGVVLAAGEQVLLREPTAPRQPVLNLVRTLVPQVALQVPATRETEGLTRWLPVPPVAVPPGQETQLPEARSLRVEPAKR